MARMVQVFEPMYPFFSKEETEEQDSGICSACFSDVGLRIEAEKFSSQLSQPCPNCKAQDGHRLTIKDCKILAYRFYILGSVQRVDYGAAPIVVFNEHQKTTSTLSGVIGEDARVFEDILGVGFFEYGPNLWMLGETTPLQCLRKKRERPAVIHDILQSYPTHVSQPGDIFFRVRTNPSELTKPEQFDSPPSHIITNGRFESKGLAVLYGSPDLETCIHESRTAVDDLIYVATLDPVQPLKLLDLTHIPENDVNPFESLDIALHYIFRAGNYSYEITRTLARSALNAGYDGILFPSYFSSLRAGAPVFETLWGLPTRSFPQMQSRIRSQTIPNVCLFGRPVAEKKLIVRSINRVHLEQAIYRLRMGPLLNEKIQISD